MNEPAASWTAAMAEVAKDEFCACRPAVSRSLVLGLWRYWQATAPDAYLFADPIQNVALLLHAQAHGAPVPQIGDRHKLGRLLRDHEELFEPLLPSLLDWGPRANLAGGGWPSVESPIMDVWVYRDGPMASGVLIVGDGLPEIREQVLPSAFLVSLSLGTLDSDLVNNGIIRVDLPLAGRPALTIPVNLLGAHVGFLPEDVPRDARQALHRFIRVLRQIADSTGLIRLHEADVDVPAQLHNGVISRAVRPSANPALWAPGLAQTTPEDGAALLPYVEIPSGAALQVSLSGDLLTTSAYEALERVHRRATIDRIKTDVALRRDLNTREAERMVREHEAYKETPKENRRAMWGDEVILDVRFDHRLGRTIYINPVREDAERYYLHNLPHLAESHRKTAILMGEILESIEAAENRSDYPIRRLLSGRLIDAAVRGRPVDDSTVLAAAFGTWSEQVRPMLWFEWRQHLTEIGAKPADVFTRNTVVHTMQAEGERGRELLMVPHTVMHQQRTAALLDRRKRVTVYHDPARYARAIEVTPQSRLAEADWLRVQELAGTNPKDANGIDLLLNEVLLTDPAENVQRLLDVLTEPAQESALKRTSPEDISSFESALDRAIEATTRLRAFKRASIALSRWAPQTARSYLGMVGSDNLTLALRAALLTAALEFLADGGDPKQPYELVAGIGPGGGARVAEAISSARSLDPNYSEQWLGLLRTVELGPAVGRLHHGLPTLEDLLPKQEEFAAWISRVAAETARIARNIEQCADMLDEDGEPVAVALAKLGVALEDSFLNEFTGLNRSAAADLLAVLTGDERSFGQQRDGGDPDAG